MDADSSLPRPRFTLGVIASAIVALLGVVLYGIGLVALSVFVLRDYGIVLFVLSPVVLGFLATLVFNWHEAELQPMKESFGVALLAQVLLGIALLLFAFEGLLCLIMAVPLSVPLSGVGVWLGHTLLRVARLRRHAGHVLLVVLLAVPALMGAERRWPGQPPLFAVRTALDIGAPPQVVWDHVIGFDYIDEEPGFLFRQGIAYPTHARIEGRGVGAIRHCVFSTGAFVEPIEVWDEPHLLRFTVTHTPPILNEWNPFHRIEPPHVSGYLVSERGQLKLTPLPGGRTRLEGTTWYRHRIAPSFYWRWWSDAIIRRIHGRVLRHIRGLAEAEMRAAAAHPIFTPAH